MYTKESPVQTTVEVFKAWRHEAFQPRWYWSSTQRSATTAFTVYFVDGGLLSDDKNDEFRVRPVRRFFI